VSDGLLTAAAAGVAAYDALVALPDSVLLGLDTQAGHSDEIKKARTTKLSVLSHTVAAGALGALVAGPVGLVCGAVIGFLSGTMSNFLDGKSGFAERRRQRVSERVQEAVGQDKGLSGRWKAALAGAAQGTKETFKTRSVTAKVQLAGAVAGIKAASQSVSAPVSPASTTRQGGFVSRCLKAAAGFVCGVSGVMINAPGGLLVGMLESLKEAGEPPEVVPSQLKKTTMLMATNVGKFLPAAAVGVLIGGPVGIAASTAVGLINASLATIIDGRFGLNQRIARPVADAVNRAHDGKEYKDGLHAYYRAGKGATVGLAVGVEQGWKTGHQGGVDIVTDMIGITEAVAAGEDQAKG
jgi:hypothetical protein